jgi:dTDP-4-dehydrorhamnose 3,5-epimerase
MKVIESRIKGLKIVELDVYGDPRGFFVERYSQQRFAEKGLPTDYVQDNHSRSAPNVLRGLHYQANPAQGKLVGVTRGRVWDVAVDIRPDSPTFGQYEAVELTGENGRLFWIPGGFAHGFCVLGDEPVDMLYKVTGLYNKAGEGGIRYNDPELGIDWPLKNPLISERDFGLPAFATYKENPPSW